MKFIFKMVAGTIIAFVTLVVVVVVLIGAGSSASTSSSARNSGTGTQVAATEVGQSPKPATEEKSEMTTSQQNAVNSAKTYLETQAFSKKGLIQQLSSSAGDGFPRADARFAVNHIHVDWNEQAVKSARNYLDIQSFSKSALIEQLSSSAGDGFTRAQAVYAANKVY